MRLYRINITGSDVTDAATLQQVVRSFERRFEADGSVFVLSDESIDQIRERLCNSIVPNETDVVTDVTPPRNVVLIPKLLHWLSEQKRLGVKLDT